MRKRTPIQQFTAIVVMIMFLGLSAGYCYVDTGIAPAKASTETDDPDDGGDEGSEADEKSGDDEKDQTTPLGDYIEKLDKTKEAAEELGWTPEDGDDKGSDEQNKENGSWPLDVPFEDYIDMEQRLKELQSDYEKLDSEDKKLVDAGYGTSKDEIDDISKDLSSNITTTDGIIGEDGDDIIVGTSESTAILGLAGAAMEVVEEGIETEGSENKNNDTGDVATMTFALYDGAGTPAAIDSKWGGSLKVWIGDDEDSAKIWDNNTVEVIEVGTEEETGVDKNNNKIVIYVLSSGTTVNVKTNEAPVGYQAVSGQSFKLSIDSVKKNVKIEEARDPLWVDGTAPTELRVKHSVESPVREIDVTATHLSGTILPNAKISVKVGDTVVKTSWTQTASNALKIKQFSTGTEIIEDWEDTIVIPSNGATITISDVTNALNFDKLTDPIVLTVPAHDAVGSITVDKSVTSGEGFVFADGTSTTVKMQLAGIKEIGVKLTDKATETAQLTGVITFGTEDYSVGPTTKARIKEGSSTVSIKGGILYLPGDNSTSVAVSEKTKPEGYIKVGNNTIKGNYTTGTVSVDTNDGFYESKATGLVIKHNKENYIKIEFKGVADTASGDLKPISDISKAKVTLSNEKKGAAGGTNPPVVWESGNTLMVVAQDADATKNYISKADGVISIPEKMEVTATVDTPPEGYVALTTKTAKFTAAISTTPGAGATITALTTETTPKNEEGFVGKNTDTLTIKHKKQSSTSSNVVKMVNNGTPSVTLKSGKLSFWTTESETKPTNATDVVTWDAEKETVEFTNTGVLRKEGSVVYIPAGDFRVVEDAAPANYSSAGTTVEKCTMSADGKITIPTSHNANYVASNGVLSVKHKLEKFTILFTELNGTTAIKGGHATFGPSTATTVSGWDNKGDALTVNIDSTNKKVSIGSNSYDYTSTTKFKIAETKGPSETTTYKSDYKKLNPATNYITVNDDTTLTLDTASTNGSSGFFLSEDQTELTLRHSSTSSPVEDDDVLTLKLYPPKTTTSSSSSLSSTSSSSSSSSSGPDTSKDAIKNSEWKYEIREYVGDTSFGSLSSDKKKQDYKDDEYWGDYDDIDVEKSGSYSWTIDTSELTDGNYYQLREVETPDDYDTDTTGITFKYTESGGVSSLTGQAAAARSSSGGPYNIINLYNTKGGGGQGVKGEYIFVNKFAVGGSTMLSDAKFTLYEGNAPARQTSSSSSSSSSSSTTSSTSSTGTVVKSWVSSATNPDANKIQITNLKKNTTYTIRETAAPVGYQTPTVDWQFTINSEGWAQSTGTTSNLFSLPANTNTITIYNQSGGGVVKTADRRKLAIWLDFIVVALGGLYLSGFSVFEHLPKQSSKSGKHKHI